MPCSVCKKPAKFQDEKGTLFCESCAGQQIGANVFRKPGLSQFFYDTFNGPRDWRAEDKLHASMYGDWKVSKLKFWKGSYVELLVGEEGEKTFIHQDGKAHADFDLAYEIFEPVDTHGREVATLVVTNGVPVNRREWYKVARLCGRFVRVVCVDLFGMGDSSMPLAFNDGKKNPKWFWSWTMHARIFMLFFEAMRHERPEWFIDNKLFFGANDWGAGALQKFVEIFGDTYLHGAAPCSMVALDGYWVQHIGSLNALAVAPYPSPTFTVETIRFAGVLTSLLETMFHRTAKIHNQYTMAPLQDPYVEIAYWDPEKNPSNTVYKEHAVRVLAEQASVILGNGDLLPRSEETWNDARIRAGKPQGLDLTMWNIPILSIWGKLDKMMPEGQVHRFRLMAAHINHRRKMDGESSNLRFEFRRLAKAGHFAVSDQPKDSAEALLTWIEGIVGLKRLATAFLGFDSIARQDEKQIIATYSTLDEFQAV